MELLVFGHAGARVLVFPTRAGRFYDYENWGLVAALRRPLELGAIQLYCVDSIDRESLYAFHRPPWERIARHHQYEGYIIEEVLPLLADAIRDRVARFSDNPNGYYYSCKYRRRKAPADHPP